MDLTANDPNLNDALVYHSAAANPAPVISASIQSANNISASPTSIVATLIWDGASTGKTFTTSGLIPGDVWQIGMQPTTSLATGAHTYTLNITAVYSNPTNNFSTSISGQQYIDNESASALGAGWTFAGVNKLVSVAATGSYPAGMLMVYGTGGYAFFALSGSTYISPVGDFGTLASVAGGYTYTAVDGTVFKFNSSGQMINSTSRDGSQVYTFTYNAGGNILTVASPDGGVGTFVYSGTTGLLTNIIGAGGQTTTVTNTGGDLVGTVDPSGGLGTYNYSSHKLISQLVGATQLQATYVSGLASSVTYGSGTSGQVIKSTLASALAGPTVQAGIGAITDELGNQTATKYDANGQATFQQNTDGTQLLYTRNSTEGITTSTDQFNLVTSYVLNSVNLPTLITRPDGTTTSYSYTGTYNDLAVSQDALNRLTSYTYDGQGHMLTMTDSLGRVTSYTWASGLMQTMTNPAGQVLTYLYDSHRRLVNQMFGGVLSNTQLYDANGYAAGDIKTKGFTTTIVNDSAGRPIETITPDGNIATSVYDSAGLLIGSISASGNRTSYIYDSDGRLTATVTGVGTLLKSTATNVYNTAGELVQSIDANGLTTSYAYNGLQQQTSMTTPNGATTTTLYDSNGRVSATINALGQTTSYLYDANGRQIATVDPLGNRSTTVYDANDNVIATVDPLGNRTSTIYDADNRVIATEDAKGNFTSTVYNSAGLVSSVTDPLNHTTTSIYDSLNRKIATIDPLGNISTTVYDSENNVVNTIDPLGRTSTSVYNSLNHIVSQTDAAGNTTTTLYDAYGRYSATTEPNGNTTSVVYDSLDRQIATIDPLGNRTTTTLDNSGRVTATVNALGKTTSYLYNSFGQQYEVINANGGITTSVYDALNRVVAKTDPMGNTTSTVYDIAGRAVETIDPLGNISTSVYDAASRVIATVDPLGNRSTTVYDSLSQVVNKIDALGKTTSLAYDAAGNNISETDPDGNTTSFSYDADNRLLVKTDPTGATTSSQYDAASELTQLIDQNSRTQSYAYDAAGRLTSSTWTVSGLTMNLLTYSYYATGQVKTAVDYSGTYSFSYDADNRIKSQTDPNGLTLTYSYDAISDVTSVADSAGGLVSSSYDALGNLLAQSQSGTGVVGLEVTYSYNADNEVSLVSRFNAASGGSLIGKTSYIYDADNRITGESEFNGSGVALVTYVNAYDADSRITSEIRNGVTVSYTYDNDSQVTLGNGTSYSYDANGNQNMTGHTVGTNNEITNDGTWTYSYDTAGNVTSRTLIAGGAYWSYSYNIRNQLTQATEKTSSSGTLLETLNYTYDVYGNLLSESVNGTTTSYAYQITDTDPGIMENVNTLWASLTSAGVVNTRFMDANGQLVSRSTSSAAYWLIEDRQGSIRDITDNTGALVDAISYNAYGAILSQSNSSLSGNILYTGSWYDPLTGLYTMHWRSYNPSTGQWMTVDPIGFAAGDANIRRYVGNDVPNRVDLSGELDKNIGLGTVVFPEIKSKSQFLLKGTLTTDSGAKIPWGVSPSDRMMGKQLILPYESYDNKKGGYVLKDVPGRFQPTSGILIYGVAMTGQFLVKGKDASAVDNQYYWVQIVRNLQTITVQNNPNADTIDTGWEFDGPDRLNKNMPNRYPGQNGLANHYIFDNPGRAYPFTIVGLKNEKSPSRAVFTFDQSLDDKTQALQLVAKTLKQTETQVFQFQTYLVSVATKKPIGYVSWGFTFTSDIKGPRISEIVQPAWNDGVDVKVWGKAKYVEDRPK